MPKRLDGPGFADHHGDTDDGKHAAADHVHDVFRLARTAVDGVGDIRADRCGCARNRVLPIEALYKEENSEGDEDDTNNVFHGDLIEVAQ